MPYYTKNDDEVDDFNEYDPTPYSGGYDITLTYGRSIPPSDETCYPLSSRSGDAFEYQRPVFSSSHEPSAYGDQALDAEYSSYARPKTRPGGHGGSGSESGRKPGSGYGGRTDVEYVRTPESEHSHTKYSGNDSGYEKNMKKEKKKKDKKKDGNASDDEKKKKKKEKEQYKHHNDHHDDGYDEKNNKEKNHHDDEKKKKKDYHDDDEKKKKKDHHDDDDEKKKKKKDYDDDDDEKKKKKEHHDEKKKKKKKEKEDHDDYDEKSKKKKDHNDSDDEKKKNTKKDKHHKGHD